MVRGSARSHDRDMTQTPHDTAGPGGQGPRVPPAQMRELNRLRRSTTDRRIAGVAGGIARHLDIDPTIVRVLLVVLIFFGGAGALVYGAVWLFVPEDGKDEAAIHIGEETRTVVLVVALVLAGLLLLGNGWWWGFDSGWPPPVIPLVVVGLVVWLVLRNRGRHGGGGGGGGTPSQQPPTSGYVPAAAATPGPAATAGPATYGTGPYGTHHAATDTPPTGQAPSAAPPLSAPPPWPSQPPKPRALFGLTMAVVLLAMGGFAVAEAAGTDLPWAAYPAAALAVIGVALLVGAFAGRSTGLVFTGLLATLLLAMAVWSPHPRFGDVRLHPVRAAFVQDSYTRTAGLIDLDLTALQDTAALDGRTLDLSMRAGEVRLLVPRDVDVVVTSSAQGGQLDVLGQVVQGRDIVNNRSTPNSAAPDLHVNVDMGFGQVRVSRP
jgi:phage shock protein PspC (stress-responsive transcriptional regulator)